jgi:general secretion pathway protein J
MRVNLRINTKGFTLLEILIALFIFSILSLLMMSALHNMIGFLTGTEKNAERLRQMQISLLLMSRDIESIVNRPAYDNTGKEEPALIGTPTTITLTHMGLASAMNEMGSSTLQRVSYYVADDKLFRKTWDAVDQAPTTRAHDRILFQPITVVFQYLDKNGKFQSNWNMQGQKSNEPLPRAIQVTFTIPQWGNLKQLYVIAVQSNLDKLK